ncbi:MAG: YceI family protein [Dehalococcoidia bacterium]
MNNKIIYICSLLCLFILACSNTTDIDSAISVNDKEEQPITAAKPNDKEEQPTTAAKPNDKEEQPTTAIAKANNVSEKSTLVEKIINIEKGSTARYIVREQLARWVSEKDVSGETQLVEGKIIISSEGKLIAKGSRFVVNVKSLKSDESKRDNYIKNNALESNKFPEAIFEINMMEGLNGPLPTSGEVNLTLIGDMTIHGVTKEISWTLLANIENEDIKGIAKTSIEFDTFDIRKPSLPFILTLDDTLRLELDFIARIQN